MNYNDASEVLLGDLVSVSVPESVVARIVMLGDSYEHLDLDPDFVGWVRSDSVLRPDSVVVEWVGDNPFAHDDPSCAPVGNYMFTPINELKKVDP